ncbi:MAG TPA: hypothetical protein VI932_03110, partial [Bacteroidota bacterium]|nr:hypothetical protein [Bacteroidota bacterium]
NVLLNALKEYEGTIVVVSHDRAFLDPLVTKVLEFTPGKMRTFLGTVSDYLGKKDEEARAARSGAGKIRSATGAALNHPGAGVQGGRSARPEGTHGRGTEDADTAAPLSEKERKRYEAEHRQKLSRELKPWKDKLAAAEKEIALLESRVAELESKMADPQSYKNAEVAKAMTIEYQGAKPRLEKAYAEWGRCTQAIDKITVGDAGHPPAN